MPRISDYQHLLKDKSSVQNWLINLLKQGANPALNYHRNSKVLNDLALIIQQVINTDTYSRQVLNIIHILIENYDYRLVANYLYARRINNSEILSIFEHLISTDNPAKINELRYQLAYAQFLLSMDSFERGQISFVSSLKEVFSQTDKRVVIHLIDPLLKFPLLHLLNDVSTRLGNFIEQQYDFPSLNALFRQGVVKMWFLPGGTAVVSKRINPQKPMRFSLEQYNYEAIVKRIRGKSCLLHNNAKGEGDVWIKIAQPFAVIWDGYSGWHYALSVRVDGISLEDILLNECDPQARSIYLIHYRLILDALYAQGILWGDMSPRNILMQRTEKAISYHIFDFEKTQLMDEPISIEKRIEHCRGQICVEEFCIICAPDEVRECFQGYFNPKEWDFESKESLPFSQRPEVADILKGRDIHNITLGKYNQIDFEMMNARIPDICPVTGEPRFPGQLNFKVEHYLSCAGYNDAGDYERKATEILIAAKQHNCFDVVISVLTQITDEVESAFLKAEFEGFLYRNSIGYLIPPQQSIKVLVHVIDVFYQLRKEAEDFRNFCLQWISERADELA